MISALATCYLFLGGTSAGSFVVLCCLEVADRARGVSLQVFSEDAFARSWTLCLCLMFLAVICLALDLGRLGDAWRLFVLPRLTSLTVGAYALTAMLVCACALGFSRVFDGARMRTSIAIVLCCVGALLGVVVMTYTGVLLQGMASVVAWQTPLLPVLFVLSSASCGTAVIFLAGAFSGWNRATFCAIGSISRIDRVFVGFEVLVLAAFVVTMFVDDRSADAAQALVFGGLATPFWVGLVGVGLAAPLVLERFAVFSEYRFQLAAIAVAVLVGGFILRWCVVELAVFDPSQVYVSSSYASARFDAEMVTVPSI